MCEQLAQGRYLKVERPGAEPATSESRVRRPINMILPGHRPVIKLHHLSPKTLFETAGGGSWLTRVKPGIERVQACTR